MQLTADIELKNIATQERDGRGWMVVQISNAIVRTHALQFGRGPTKARTFVQGDVIVCVLEDIFTPAERTLIESGKPEPVQQLRRAFQETMREPFISVVEEVSGRRVRGFFSQIDMEINAGVEVFLLHPATEPHSSTEAMDGDAARGASS